MGGKHPSKFALLLEGIKITPTTSRITLGNYTPIDNIVILIQKELLFM